MEVTKRYRVNVSTTVKGIKTYDCTVDISRTQDGIEVERSNLMEDILWASDQLVAELDRRYPAPLEGK